MKETKFKQTEVGMIPSDWMCRPLGELCKVQNGYAFRSEKFATLGNTVIRISDIEDSKVSLKNTVKYPLSEQIPNQFVVRKGNFLIAMSGATTGKIGLYENANPALINQRVGRFDVTKKEELEPIFLFHLLRGDIFTSFLQESLATGAQPNISGKQIESCKIPLPSTIEEQQRIANTLSDVDTLIANLEKLIDKKKNIKQGAMQQLLTGKKRLPGFAPDERTGSRPTDERRKACHSERSAKREVEESSGYKMTELGIIPSDWEVKKLKEIGVFSKGAGISRDESNSGNIPAVRYGEIYTKHNDYIKEFYSHISQDVAEKSVKMQRGDLLFSASGETKEDIGKTIAFVDDFDAYAGGDIIIFTPMETIDSIYMGYLLNFPSIAKQKAMKAQGDAVVHITTDSLKKLIICLPSYQEQTAIANVLSDMDTEISALETKLEKYRTLKTGMMQQLLTGKIRLV